MASAKYQELAREYLLEEVDALAAWLEAHVAAIRKEQGEGVMVFIDRGSALSTEDMNWHYGNLTFELSYGTEVI